MKLPDFIVKDWQIKLASIVLAVLIWHLATNYR